MLKNIEWGKVAHQKYEFLLMVERIQWNTQWNNLPCQEGIILSRILNTRACLKVCSHLVDMIKRSSEQNSVELF
jgi:hypothetical protein